MKRRREEAEKATCPDERWATDVMQIQVGAGTYFVTSFMDEYSRYLVHFEIAPGRKLDPGPHFPLVSYRENLFGDAKATIPFSSSTATVAVDLLNVRTTPSESGDLAARPLKRGSSVNVLAEAGGWSKVEVSVEAWVKSQFLKKS